MRIKKRKKKINKDFIIGIFGLIFVFSIIFITLKLPVLNKEIDINKSQHLLEKTIIVINENQYLKIIGLLLFCFINYLFVRYFIIFWKG